MPDIMQTMQSRGWQRLAQCIRRRLAARCANRQDNSRLLSKHSIGDDKAEQQQCGAERNPESETPLEFGANDVAIAVEQDGADEKTHPATDQRAENEQPDIVAGKTRGDGHELVWNRRQ